VDADLASNSASWQWVAGSGTDAAPYFRIFNPVLQGQKFDAQGDYIRRYIPELKTLPSRYIHTPWEAPEQVLKDAGVELGSTYPHPILDLKQSRQAALTAYSSLKEQPDTTEIPLAL
jgi:deoxyribodipyrimidine photo-lyase